MALVAALAGDSFLLSEEMFVYGLSSFLVMQLLYSYCFTKDFVRSKSALFYTLLVIALILFVAYKLWPDLGSLKIPVVVYMTAIGLMTITAYCREKSLSGYRWIFIGTLLFVVSDTVLGIHQFNSEINLGKLTVMSTYTAAQFAIVQGFMDRHLS